MMPMMLMYTTTRLQSANERGAIWNASGEVSTPFSSQAAYFAPRERPHGFAGRWDYLDHSVSDGFLIIIWQWVSPPPEADGNGA